MNINLPDPDHTDRSELIAQAFTVLRESLDDLADRGRPATASEVRLRMKRRTYSGFDPKALGFKRFRDFLDAARETGIIEIDEDRAGDVAVKVPGALYQGTGTTGPSSRIRSDLWKALADWKPTTTRAVDLAADRVVSFPASPVPLEPAEFGNLRARIKDGDPSVLLLASIPWDTQKYWMKAFAEESGDTALGVVVDHADSIDPFVAALNADPDVRMRWSTARAERIRQYVIDWHANEPDAAGFNPWESGTADSAHADHRTPGLRHGGEPHPAGSRPEDETPTANSRVSPPLSRKRPSNPMADLRQRLHTAIDRMPDEQLRSINIPIGYLFEEG